MGPREESHRALTHPPLPPAGGASELPEADEAATEEAEPAGAGEGPPARGAQQGRPGPQQAGEPVPRAAAPQPLPQGGPGPPLLSAGLSLQKVAQTLGRELDFSSGALP